MVPIRCSISNVVGEDSAATLAPEESVKFIVLIVIDKAMIGSDGESPILTNTGVVFAAAGVVGDEFDFPLPPQPIIAPVTIKTRAMSIAQTLYTLHIRILHKLPFVSSRR